ncbi:TraR/DksA family transcriptional regulator [Chloroflexi bacterium TSY]|nr:TraR/DksA family transcriptional regulator [Chloroflexi bacterium TSY]
MSSTNNSVNENAVPIEQTRLLQEKSQVEDELNTLRQSMQTEVDIDPEEGDAEIFEREKNAVLIDVLERKLDNIEAALTSMEKGRYGTCERCNEPIEPERLEIKPDATLCVNCQREVERLNRRGRATR